MSPTPRGRARALTGLAAAGAVAAALALPATASAAQPDTVDLEQSLEAGSTALGVIDDAPGGVSGSLQSLGTLPPEIANPIEVGVDVLLGQRNPMDLVNALDFNGSLAPTAPCNAVQTGGGEVGVQRFNVPLGRTGPTSFVLTYDTINVPDKVAVYAPGGAPMWRTYDVPGNVDGYVSTHGNVDQLINVPAGVSTAIVEVTADKSNTQWSFTAHCPA